MRIEWDKEKNKITVGKAVYKDYQYFKTPRGWVHDVFCRNGLPVPREDSIRETNKAIGDILGCSYSRMFKMFNALQFKAFVAPVYHLLKTVRPYNHLSREIDPKTLREIRESKDLLEAVYADGLHNIMPVVFATKRSPQELKKVLKGSWKVIAKNSNHRNKIIVQRAKRFYGSVTLDEALKDPDLAVYALWWWGTDLPTTLLQNEALRDPRGIEYLVNNFKGSWKNSRDMCEAYQEFRDTRSMLSELREDINTANPKWSPRRLKEEHDRLVHRVNALKYSNEPIKWLEDFPVKTFEHKGHVATLLNTKFQIAMEGVEMVHCVASYAGSVAEGNYLVYSVAKDGVVTSTIGYTVHPDAPYLVVRLQQHNAKHNFPVRDASEITLGYQLEKEINKLRRSIPQHLNIEEHNVT